MTPSLDANSLDLWLVTLLFHFRRYHRINPPPHLIRFSSLRGGEIDRAFNYAFVPGHILCSDGDNVDRTVTPVFAHGVSESAASETRPSPTGITVRGSVSCR